MSRPVQRLTVPTQKSNHINQGFDAFMSQRRAAVGNARNPGMASCGNCGTCSQCCLPSVNCSNAAGNVQNANVQVSVGSTGNCVPNVNQPTQVNSLGVCVQPVNFNQGVPSLSVINSCAGQQTDTVLLPNGGIYNTNISNNQPLIGIPGVFCNTCGQSSMNCACSAGSKRWYRAGAAMVTKKMAKVSSKPMQIQVLQDEEVSQQSSRSSKWSSASSSQDSFVPAPRFRGGMVPPTKNAKAAETKQEAKSCNPRVVVEYATKPAGCSSNGNCCGTGCTCPSPCTGNCVPTCTGTCCTTNTCSSTSSNGCNSCPNMCSSCGGCQCLTPCANVNFNKVVPCNCNFLNLNIGQQTQCNTCGYQTANITNGCCTACAANAKKTKASKGHKAGSHKPAKATSRKSVKAGCNCPNMNNCGGCSCGNCAICPFGCVNSFATTTDPCSNVTSTLQQIAPSTAGQVPCPPTNPVFCNPINIPTFINTWYQSFWDYYTLWNCVNDIPLQFQQTGYLPASAPNTGVYGVALSGSGYLLAVSYETGFNQYAGIDIYYINYNTFNRIQTIIPMPTNTQCGFNMCCNAFNISMSFSNDGSVLAVGMPNLGASGCVFIFRLNCGQYEMCAELQPGAMTGPNGTTGNPLFGYSVWVSGLGQRVVIGCPMCNGGCGNGCTTISGSVVTCRPCVGSTWEVEQIITPQGNNSFIPFLINGSAANANPYQLFATNPSGLIQPSFGRSVATDDYSNNIVVGSNNIAFVFGNVNSNQANVGGNYYGAGSIVGNSGPFELISTLSGVLPGCSASPNLFDQGIAVAISGDGLTVAVSSIAGTGVTYPIIPAAVFVFRRNPYSYALGNGAVSNAYTQVAALASNSGYLRAGSPASQAGLWISFDGSFIIAGDPNCSILGAAPDGCISAWMNTYAGWVNYYTITSPIPNCNFGTFVAVNLGLSQLFATGPSIANPNGSTGTVIMYQ